MAASAALAATSAAEFPLSRRDGQLLMEEAPLEAVAARFGTPCYVYSRAALERAYRAFTDALTGHDALVCYAMKANSNLAVLNLFARLGAGFDVVSGGELARVLAAGGDPAKVVFSGVGKTASEMRQALAARIYCFNVESASELRRLEEVARSLGVRAPISIRVNPDVDPKTHPYISTGLRENKFGVPFESALPLYRHAHASAHLEVIGVDCHIGSQITETAPFLEALDKALGLIDAVAADGIRIAHLDVGGGLGIRYRDETPPSIAEYASHLFERLGTRRLKLLFEPGRVLVGNAGVLLTTVQYLKDTPDKRFAIVDAAMNDLTRPALYDAFHQVEPLALRAGTAQRYDIVGPVCESADFLARDRALALAEGDRLAILSAGAYGMTMSSNYNTRARAAEVIVDGSAIHLVRRREDVAELLRLESLLPL